MKVVTIDNVSLEALCSLNPNRYPFLLESVSHNKDNRYSILFAHPQQQITLNNLADFDFLSKLESHVDMPIIKSDLPFTGGWFVYLSYELIGQIEPILKKDLPLGDMPIAIAVEIPSAIVVDHVKQQSYLLDQFANQNRIDQILEDIGQLTHIEKKSITGALSSEVASKYLQGVEKSRDYIIAGDVFQVNLSREWQYKLDQAHSPSQIYAALKQSNPAPFAA